MACLKWSLLYHYAIIIGCHRGPCSFFPKQPFFQFLFLDFISYLSCTSIGTGCSPCGQYQATSWRLTEARLASIEKNFQFRMAIDHCQRGGQCRCWTLYGKCGTVLGGSLWHVMNWTHQLKFTKTFGCCLFIEFLGLSHKITEPKVCCYRILYKKNGRSATNQSSNRDLVTSRPPSWTESWGIL